MTQGRAKPIEDQVHDLRQQLQKVCQFVAHHDTSLRELDSWSTYTVLLGSDTDLAKTLVLHLEQWKGQLPPRGQPHPLGPARHTVAGALAQWLLSAEPSSSSNAGLPASPRCHGAACGSQQERAAVLHQDDQGWPPSPQSAPAAMRTS